MISDPKYNFSVCPKKNFVLQSKVNIFHQIQPRNNFKGSVTQKGYWVLAKKSLGIQKYCMGQWARVKIGKCGKIILIQEW